MAKMMTHFEAEGNYNGSRDFSLWRCSVTKIVTWLVPSFRFRLCR